MEWFSAGNHEIARHELDWRLDVDIQGEGGFRAVHYDAMRGSSHDGYDSVPTVLSAAAQHAGSEAGSDDRAMDQGLADGEPARSSKYCDACCRSRSALS